MWLGYVNFMMIGWIFLKSLNNETVNTLLSHHTVLFSLVCVAGFLFGMVFVGWLDCKLGIRKAEVTNLSKQNPLFIEMYNRLQRIESHLHTDHSIPQDDQRETKQQTPEGGAGLK